MISRRNVARLLLAALVALGSTLVAASPSASARVLPRESNPSSIDFEVTPGPETVIGTELTLAATVRRATGPLVDAGLMEFLDGDERIGVVEVDHAGTASITFVPPTVGRHELQASYMGSPPNFEPATSRTVEHTVTGDPPLVPEVRLFGEPKDRSPAGSTVELYVTVKNALEDPRINGSVVFLDGDLPIGTAELTLYEDYVNASIEVELTQGVHQLSARYVGNLPEIGPSRSGVLTYSSLPETCADQAVPGQGALVRLAYQAVLRRCPDPAGFTYWTGYLDAGGNPATFARSLALGAEGTAATVDAAYRQVLERPSDPAGRAVWAAKLRAGWTTSQLWAALAASPEFVAGGGSVVDRAFERLVGRPVDEPSRAYWTDRLSSGPRSGALRALVLTPEALGRIVDGIHLSVLGHAPTSILQPEIQTGIKARRGDWRNVVVDVLGWAYPYAQTYPDPAG